MYSDELEESLNEEIIKIMMYDQSSNEAVAITVSPSAQRPPEREVISRTPSPRSSPCPSPVHFIRPHDRVTDISKAGTLSPMSCTSIPTHIQQRVDHPALKLKFTTNGPSSVGSSITGDAGIKAEEERDKMGGTSTKKTGSSTMSALDATSFQKRLFGLHHPVAQGKKSYTLPFTGRTASSKSISDLKPLTGPAVSPATLTDSPCPPPEPTELKYFECNEVKVRHLVAKMSHANSCSAMTCSEICIYIKWFAKHRRSCTVIFNSQGSCEYCHKFIQWQYQHCVNCKCCPSKGCSDNIGWCPVIKQSILKNKLESCIAPLVRQLQNGFCVDQENSCPRQKAIERYHPEEYHKLLRELTDFDCAALLDEWNLCDVFQGDPQGTIHYNPPELYCLGQSSWSLDVWQVACCVLFMCTGCRPWRHAYFDCAINHQNRKCVVQSIKQKISSYPNHLLPGFLPTTLHTLLSKCLHSDWKNRLTPLDAMYLLDSDYKSRNKLLSDHDIIGSPCTVSATPSDTTHSDNTPVAVDVYLAEYTERIPGLYLQPGWIASVSLPHTKTVTYGDVKSLLYNNTELEVMRYLTPCDFYTYKNDRIKIRDLLIKERTLDEFSKMNESDIVHPDIAIIMR